MTSTCVTSQYMYWIAFGPWVATAVVQSCSYRTNPFHYMYIKHHEEISRWCSTFTLYAYSETSLNLNTWSNHSFMSRMPDITCRSLLTENIVTVFNTFNYSTFIPCTNSDFLIGWFVPRDTGLWWNNHLDVITMV